MITLVTPVGLSRAAGRVTSSTGFWPTNISQGAEVLSTLETGNGIINDSILNNNHQNNNNLYSANYDSGIDIEGVLTGNQRLINAIQEVNSENYNY